MTYYKHNKNKNHKHNNYEPDCYEEYFCECCEEHCYEPCEEHHCECCVGPQGPQGEVGPQGEQGPQGEKGVFDMETKYEALETENKTVLGSINEVYDVLEKFMDPVYDIKAQMYYGVMDPNEVGVVYSYEEITKEMLDKSTGIKSTRPGERKCLSIGYVDEGMYIVVAVPAIYNFGITKDDGFGGRTEFDESIIGANGIDVEFDGDDYRLYGEFVIVGGYRTIFIEERENPTVNCNCEDLTTDDIDDVMSDIFNDSNK